MGDFLHRSPKCIFGWESSSYSVVFQALHPRAFQWGSKSLHSRLLLPWSATTLLYPLGPFIFAQFSPRSPGSPPSSLPVPTSALPSAPFWWAPLLHTASLSACWAQSQSLRAWLESLLSLEVSSYAIFLELCVLPHRIHPSGRLSVRSCGTLTKGTRFFQPWPHSWWGETSNRNY